MELAGNSNKVIWSDSEQLILAGLHLFNAHFFRSWNKLSTLYDQVDLAVPGAKTGLIYDQVTKRLQCLGLIQATGETHYQLHPAFKFLISSKAPNIDRDTAALIEDNWLKFYLDLAKELHLDWRKYDSVERTDAFLVTQLEIENIRKALFVAIARGKEWETLSSLLGHYYHAVGELDHLIHLLLSLEDLVQANGKAEALNRRIGLLDTIGNTFIALKEFSKGKSYFERALSLSEKLQEDDPWRERIQIILLHNLSGTVNDASDKVGYLKEARKKSILYSYSALGGTIAYNLSEALYMRGDYEESEAMLEEAIRSFKKDEDYPVLQQALQSKANFAQNQGRYQLAENCLKEALDISKRIAAERAIAEIYQALASLYYLQNKLPLANDFVNRALTCFIELKESALQEANAYNLMSVLAFTEGDAAAGFEYANRAIMKYEAVDSYDLMGQTHANLGVQCLNFGWREEALSSFATALDCYAEAGNFYKIAQVRVPMGQLFYQLEDTASAILHFYLAALYACEVNAAPILSDIQQGLSQMESDKACEAQVAFLQSILACEPDLS